MPRFGGLRSTPGPQQTPRRNKKGTRGNPRESRGRLRRAEEHSASPHDVADPASQQGPSGHCDPPSATKRPAGSQRPQARKQCRSEVGTFVRLGTVSERPQRRKIQSTVAPYLRHDRALPRAVTRLPLELAIVSLEQVSLVQDKADLAQQVKGRWRGGIG